MSCRITENVPRMHHSSDGVIKVILVLRSIAECLLFMSQGFQIVLPKSFQSPVQLTTRLWKYGKHVWWIDFLVCVLPDDAKSHKTRSVWDRQFCFRLFRNTTQFKNEVFLHSKSELRDIQRCLCARYGQINANAVF